MPPARRRPRRTVGGPVADAIIACVAEHGAARFWQIAAATGTGNGPLGFYLHHLVASGRLARPARGIYMIPGTTAEIPPAAPRPPGTTDAPASVSARNRARWAKLTPEQRTAATAPMREAARRVRARKQPQPD